MQTLVRAIQRILGTEKNVECSEDGGLHITQSGAEYEELTRSGYSFSCISSTTAAGVVALPTTAAQLSIWNSADDGGRSIIIDALFAVNIVNGATLGQAGLIYVLGQTRVASNAGTLVPRKLNGKGPGSDTVALCGDSGTALDAVTGVAIGWTPIGPSVNVSVVSLPGLVLWAPIDGRLIIAPGHLLGINVMTSNVENTWRAGAMWHEKQITLV
ncbi:MAG: hypothetical protein WC364_05690 [Eubacteriales bacterium]|jgi:hypothetical protein